MAVFFNWHILIYLVSIQHFSSSSKGAIGSVNDDELHILIAERNNVIVLFCKGDISPECMQKTKEINKALESSMTSDIMAAVALDSAIAQKYGFKTFPQLVLYRETRPLLYYAQHNPEGDLTDWLDRSTQLATRELHEDSFEHDTQAGSGATTGDWFVMLVDNRQYTFRSQSLEGRICNGLTPYDKEDCPEVLPTWEALAVWLKQRLNVATVDVARNPALRTRFSVNKCPTLILFHHGLMYTYDLNLRDIESLTNFAEGWYKNVAGVKVPVDPSPFDQLTDDIAAYLKSLDPKLVLGASVGSFMVLSALVLCCVCRTKDKREEKDKEE